ncbi:MAG TPA: PepSY domain-containing protein [Planctomycetota bacterium]|nr:PepSY domain-containing protein [Planctomycetota bacterium]
MRSALLASAIFLAPSAAGPDYAALLKDAKIPLSEAIDKASKEVPDWTPLSAYMEDNEGKPCFFVYLAKDRKTVEVSIDLKSGSIAGKETLDDDDSKILAAVKISLKKAIEIALQKVPGKAVYADFDIDEKGPAEAEVDVFADGKVTRVLIDAVKGEVIKTEPKP